MGKTRTLKFMWVNFHIYWLSKDIPSFFLSGHGMPSGGRENRSRRNMIAQKAQFFQMHCMWVKTIFCGSLFTRNFFPVYLCFSEKKLQPTNVHLPHEVMIHLKCNYLSPTKKIPIVFSKKTIWNLMWLHSNKFGKSMIQSGKCLFV